MKEKTTNGRDRKVSVEEFTKLAIERLRKPGRTAIHTVYSGFNAAFRAYFPDVDPVDATQSLAQRGKIVTRITKGGALIGLPGELEPAASGSDALKKMGLK